MTLLAESRQAEIRTAQTKLMKAEAARPAGRSRKQQAAIDELKEGLRGEHDARLKLEERLEREQAEQKHNKKTKKQSNTNTQRVFSEESNIHIEQTLLIPSLVIFKFISMAVQ